jgi:hypothetical protein
MLEPVAPEPVSERRLSNDRDRGAKAEDEQQTPAVRPRRGRTSMPSWDEIVFGRDEP